MLGFAKESDLELLATSYNLDVRIFKEEIQHLKEETKKLDTSLSHRVDELSQQLEKLSKAAKFVTLLVDIFNRTMEESDLLKKEESDV